jgi:ATP-dependent DNA ligase
MASILVVLVPLNPQKYNLTAARPVASASAPALSRTVPPRGQRVFRTWVSPMLARSGRGMPVDLAEWAIEPKWDGWRCLTPGSMGTGCASSAAGEGSHRDVPATG